MSLYSAKLLDHFHHPRNVGEIERPSAAAEAVNPVCGDVLKLSVAMQGNVLTEVRFKAAGCVPAVACGSWLSEYLQAKRFEDLLPLPAASIAEALEGLPRASHHAAVLAAEAMQRLLEELARIAP